MKRPLTPIVVSVLMAGCGGRAGAARPASVGAGDRPASPTAPAPHPLSAFDAAFSSLCYGPDAVPVEIAGSRHFVPVTIRDARGGARTLRFHVDTGGSTKGVNLNLSVARELGYNTAEELPRSLRVGARDVVLPRGAEWLLLDDSASDHFRKSFSVGQLGAGFLSRYTVCFDASRARVGFAAADEVCEPVDLPWLPFSQIVASNGAIYAFVFVRIGGGGYGMLVDTGATTSMLTSRPIEWLAAQHPDWHVARGAAGDPDMIGSSFVERMLRVPSVTVGSTMAQNHAAAVEQALTIAVPGAIFVERPSGTFAEMFGTPEDVGSSVGAVGNEILNRYRFVLDYARSRLYIEPTSIGTEDVAPLSRVGVSLDFPTADGCPRVRAITDTNDPSVLASLHVGDVLRAVNGADACRAYHHEISDTLAGPPGTTKTLRVEREGTELTLEVRTAQLL